MPARPRRTVRKIVKDLDPLAFLAGWRAVQPPEMELQPALEGIRVDVIRPEDLVALECTFTDCDLEAGGAKPPALVPRKNTDALLVVDFAFQHAHEEAIYEQVPTTTYVPDQAKNSLTNKPVADPHVADQSTATSAPLMGFRPARRTRLVFDLQGEPVEFSTNGILTAMKRLPLVLHPMGAPGGTAPAPTPGGITGLIGGFEVLHLGDGLIAELRDRGPVLLNPSKKYLDANPAPDTNTTAGMLEVARNLARLRAASARQTPTVLEGTTLPAGSMFRPGAGVTVREPHIPPFRVRRNKLSRPPTVAETAIEAPFRLVVSPTTDGRFTHAVDPVGAADEPGNVELWHTRLASVPLAEGKDPNEDDHGHRVIRAIWARDRDRAGNDWRTAAKEFDPGYVLSHPQSIAEAEPFLGSLDALDRHMLVRQSAETWISEGKAVPPLPVGADALWLSTLGAWLDLHGVWDTRQYSAGGIQSILSWDHRAPMGRDQFVRVVYPGYLFPFGHQAALVKITERKMKDVKPSYAGLYQRMFLVVGERSRSYGERRLPFSRVDIRPLMTPPIDFPGGGSYSGGTITEGISTVIWPKVGGQDFVWTLDTSDKDAQQGRFHLPLMWVNQAFLQYPAINATYLGSTRRIVEASGQNVAFVPKQDDKPDSRLEARRIFLAGSARLGGSDPTLSAAEVVLPAVQRISPTDPLAIRYRDEYVAQGLGGADAGDVWAEVIEGAGGQKDAGDPTSAPTSMSFGAKGAGSDRSGGFISPDLPIKAISAATGPVGDVASAVQNNFDPEAFLQGALPKLFGLIDLVDLLVDGGMIPAVVTDTLGRIQHFVTDVEELESQVQDAVKEAQQLTARAQDKSTALQQAATKALTDAQDAAAKVQALVAAVAGLLDPSAAVPAPGVTDATLAAKAKAVADAAAAALPAVRIAAPQLPPLVRDQLAKYTAIVAGLAEDVTALTDALKQARDLLEAQELSFHFDWRPALQNWPATNSIFTLEPSTTDHLVISVDGRVSAQGKSDVTVAAELRDFSLTLFGSDSLMRVPFDHMSFKAGTAGKTEVDVVLGQIEFLGILSFVETIKDLIPFDGFSDPPYMDVTAEGATAGFTLALPSVSIGVFTLANMSLGADVSVPFLGKSVTVGFNFCTRERPFTLAVMCLGGGGWFLIRVAPDGLDVLEVGLEATACLSVDFGVASGSISASIGIYIRLEGQKGSLAGYFRLRGEVDVLGLISASIELYMELIYHFDTGKMIGRATITVEVEVLCFSGSVQISAERQFAGSNGDPSFREILGAQGGTSPYWTEYAAAFASEEV